MRDEQLYRVLAQAVDAHKRCIETGNKEWEGRHEDFAEALVKRFLPSGSGFDNGTTIDIAASGGEKLVFHTSYHHMDENGYYDGWSEHTVTVWPSLRSDFRMTISGRNQNNIKDYIHEVFDVALREFITDEIHRAMMEKIIGHPLPA